MAKESTHAIRHWLNVEASEAAQLAASAHDLGHVFPVELCIHKLDLEDLMDDFRAGSRDPRYYDSARRRALEIASRLLRFAVMAHRASVSGR